MLCRIKHLSGFDDKIYVFDDETNLLALGA